MIEPTNELPPSERSPLSRDRETPRQAFFLSSSAGAGRSLELASTLRRTFPRERKREREREVRECSDSERVESSETRTRVLSRHPGKRPVEFGSAARISPSCFLRAIVHLSVFKCRSAPVNCCTSLTGLYDTFGACQILNRLRSYTHFHARFSPSSVYLVLSSLFPPPPPPPPPRLLSRRRPSSRRR